MRNLNLSSRGARPSLHGALPVVLLAVLITALVALVVITGRDPVVSRVEPLVAAPGDRVSIHGRQFRDDQGSLIVAGVQLPRSNIQEWSPERIDFTVPPGTDSGLLYVRTDRGTSNGVLLQMRSSVPTSRAAGFAPGAPVISRLQETAMNIGDVLVIQGRNFGSQRRDSRVLFSSPADGGFSAPLPASISYPRWTEEEIHVRIPEDALSGFVIVQTPWGDSNPLRLSVGRPAGGMVRGERVEVVVQYGVIVDRVVPADSRRQGPGSRDLVAWLPRLPSGTGQANVRYLLPVEGRTVDGFAAVRFETVDAAFSARVVHTAAVERFAVRADIERSRVSPAYEGESGFFAFYTQPTALLPAGDQAFATVAAAMRRNRANPYLIALAAYEWTIEHLDYSIHAEDRSAIAGLQEGYGDDFTYAALFATVLRAARVPSRLVGGVLISGQGDAYPHFWVEFFVSGAGWIPADPALGDGAFPAAFPEPANPAEFYFGNLDGFRVAFHHGEGDTGPALRNGAHIEPDDPYTAQRSYLEVGAGIDDIRARWLMPRVVGFRP